ncbi:hypothetical protein [Spongiimicrobium salis]|uniref:hypothetical protein n=1 Tax=Spongiimicrobium salis TaxID=1667022 RepID=UPI00374DF536
MSRYYKEKAPLATKAKIARLHKESGFFRKNRIKIIFFGIVFSLWAPFHERGFEGTMRDITGMNYLKIGALSLIFYTLFCFLGHTVWTYQERQKMKALQQKKTSLEQELNKE